MLLEDDHRCLTVMTAEEEIDRRLADPARGVGDYRFSPFEKK
jgi:hypothetical protein